jgi:hypothetical protein
MKLNDLPNDILSNIYTFVRRPMILKPNIINDLLLSMCDKDNDKFWLGLNHNINAIDLLKKKPNKIEYIRLITNINSLDIIENNIEYIDTRLVWEYLSQNPGLCNIISKNINNNMLSWFHISRNKNAINIILENFDKIDWIGLVLNTNAIEILENNIDKINTSLLIYNDNIFNSTILREYIENNIYIYSLQDIIKNKSVIKSTKIINIIKNYLSKEEFYILSEPYNAFHSDIIYFYLIKNYNSIDWNVIFNYNEFLKSYKMIKVIETIFLENNIELFTSNLWNELLAHPLSLEIPELYNIIIKNKKYINFFYIGMNYNIFYNKYFL